MKTESALVLNMFSCGRRAGIHYYNNFAFVHDDLVQKAIDELTAGVETLVAKLLEAKKPESIWSLVGKGRAICSTIIFSQVIKPFFKESLKASASMALTMLSISLPFSVYGYITRLYWGCAHRALQKVEAFL